MKVYLLPTVKAAIELSKGNSFQALMFLETAAPYEMGGPLRLHPAYLRGQAYLLVHNGTAASAEFQKLLNHRGIVAYFFTGALAHLQIGSAYAMAGDTRQSQGGISGFPYTVEKCRPRHLHHEASQSGVREAAMTSPLGGHRADWSTAIVDFRFFPSLRLHPEFFRSDLAGGHHVSTAGTKNSVGIVWIDIYGCHLSLDYVCAQWLANEQGGFSADGS
jgi:hypothetical protein